MQTLSDTTRRNKYFYLGSASPSYKAFRPNPVLPVPLPEIPSSDALAIESNADIAVITLPKSYLTIHDLGWNMEEAIALRTMLGGIAEDWDDPEMDIYDEKY